MDQLRSLRVFVQVIADGSFASAARALDMAPAVVTRAVADLEEHLGARLLNRTTRSLALTEVGEAYFERARQVLADLNEADQLAASVSSQLTGKLKVLCPPAFATHQLVRHLPRFCQQYPGVSLELGTKGPVESADEGFDVSIVSLGAQPLQGEFVARPLAHSNFVVCAAPSYLAQCGVPLEPLDLMHHKGVLLAVSAMRKDVALVRQVADTSPQASHRVLVQLHEPVLASSHIDTVYAATLAGLGIAGLPTFVAEAALKDGRLQRVLPEWQGALPLRLYAATPTRKHMPQRTKAFVEFLVQTFGGSERDPWL
ncbi:LysR family transcriptional regulator [Rhodoferax aquaticus]|uniref:LysR family transcriptional regulator n=1 Tax=Rhodoferax aquaticus TaxID=2527691 RepID=A0A515EPU7_9BURK|nr:LysR family transcriptional regulator [Rhodoferax aquaticus]QDL54640.1 LysR family transcriptional regulator [Rhodoferax aquaticus]